MEIPEKDRRIYLKNLCKDQNINIKELLDIEGNKLKGMVVENDQKLQKDKDFNISRKLDVEELDRIIEKED